MTSGVVTVGRRLYASGLYWENSPTGRVSQAAKEAAHQPGNVAEYYAIRFGNKQGRVPQFGLATPAEGVRAGLPSLAGCLANQQPGSWIGAFRLKEGTALVVIRDDLIVPDGDAFFLDETEARDRLFQEMAVGGFQRIYAPEAWGVPGADTMPVSLLLNERSDVRLRSITLSTQAKVGISIGFALLLLLLGAGWYIQDQRMQVEIEHQRELEALERMRREAARMAPAIMQDAPVYPPPERKWESRPRPLDLVKACQDALGKVSVRVAGWRITGLACNESGLRVSWTRSGGFSSPPPGSSTGDTVSSAVSQYAFSSPLEPRGEEQLVDPDVVTKRYLGQNWPGVINRALDDPLPPPPPGYKGNWNPPPAPWVKRSFTVTVPVLPWTLPVFLSDLPGVIVTAMNLNGSGSGNRDSWTVEGVIYENRR